MPIHAPGKRSHSGKRKVNARKIVGTLSLTAMVDMFSVLTVFLINYSGNAQLIDVPKDVRLPEAAAVKELKPSHVVTIGQTDVFVDKINVGTLAAVKAQKEWMIPRMHQVLREEIQKKLQEKNQGIRQALTKAVKGQGAADRQDPADKYVKITIQSDKEIDFLTVKKVMYTITEAGGEEINFAVSKKEKKIEVTN